MTNVTPTDFVTKHTNSAWWETMHGTRIDNYRLNIFKKYTWCHGERGGSVVECRTPEREVGGSKPIAAVLCPWARHFTPRKYWSITQEAVASSRYDWKIVDWDVKPQHKQNKTWCHSGFCRIINAFSRVLKYVDIIFLLNNCNWYTNSINLCTFSLPNDIL